MQILVLDDIFVTQNVHVVSSHICLEYNNFYFPCEDWTDFAFPILEEWKNNLIQVLHSDNTYFNLYFHDGPFWLEVYKNENMELKIECISDRKVRKTELVIYCKYRELLEAIYNALKMFSKVLYKNGMHEGAFASVYEQTILSITEVRNFLKSFKD